MDKCTHYTRDDTDIFCRDCGDRLEKDKKESTETEKVQPLKVIDWTSLLSLAQEYIDFEYSPDYHEDNDFSHYIFEQAIETIYGKDVFDKLNKLPRH